MRSFSIQIPNDKAATYKVVTLIIAIINLLTFGFSFLNRHGGSSGVLAIVGFIVSLLLLMALIFNKDTGKLAVLRVGILFIVCALLWFFTGSYLLGLLLLGFALLGFITFNKKVIDFSAEGIKYPSFPVKSIPWKEVDFVILKDDILTIEMKNNRLMQFTLEKGTSSTINPQEFNHFCKEQLAG
jgi:hypothetical protein